MSELKKIVGDWDRLIATEWLAEVVEINGSQKPYLCNKIYYASRKAAAKSMIYYLEHPHGREGALAQALIYRDFSDGYRDDKTDEDLIAKDITQRVLGVGEETASIEKPEWMDDDDWKEAQNEALQDSEGNLLQPKIEGFLTGAYYAMPSVWPSEHDEDNARRMITNCMQAVLMQCQQSVLKCTKWLRRANSAKFKATWENRTYFAIQIRKVTEKFIEDHDLYYEEDAS